LEHPTNEIPIIERLREFIRFGYVTGAEVARRIGVHDATVYSWIQGEFLPANPKQPFCKKAKGEIRKVRGGFKGVCPNCGASGEKRESHDAALGAWNGKS